MAQARGISPMRRRKSSPTRKSYSVGDTAHLLLVTGLAESWAVVTTEGNSVQSRQLIHLTGASAPFDVPITQQAQPNLVVTAVIVHDDQLMTAQKSLKVPLVERTFTITATPNKTQYEPEETASFDVSQWIPRASLFRPT